jgi:hypothetical protein
MRRSLCLQNNGDDSSTNLEESFRIDGLPQRFEPTSLATSGPTPSEESCLKRAAGCSLERSRKVLQLLLYTYGNPSSMQRYGWEVTDVFDLAVEGEAIKHFGDQA